MAEAQAVQKTRQRSPNYPAISLPEAVERAQKLYSADGRAGSLLESAVKYFGFNRPHGTAMTLVSAMRKYGLIEVANNRVTLTKRAIDILVFPDDDTRKITAIQAAALAPEIYQDLYKRYSERGQLPSEQSLKAELEAEMKFNPRAVADFVRDFKATLTYARLLAEDGVTLRQSEETQLKVGDFVQWESGGALQFKEPQRLREISEDGKFAFMEGSNTGVPMHQLIPAAPVVHPDAKKLFQRVADSIPGTGHTFNVWTLAPGVTAELKISGQTSPEELDMLRDYVEITIKALKRNSAKAEKAKKE